MRKADIQRSYHQGHVGMPMVNVKTHGVMPDTDAEWRALAVTVADDIGSRGEDTDLFAEWVMSLYDADDSLFHDTAWEAACEQGWIMLQTDAEETFGPAAKVYSAGRSGGWCVVEGIGDVDGWDAVMVAKWGRFCKWAAGTVESIPYDMVAFLYLNHWEARREAIEQAAGDMLAGVSASMGVKA